MKKIVAIGIGATAAVVALAGFAAVGRLEHRNPYDFITRRVDAMLNEIKATDAQRAQINQVKDKLFNEGTELRKTQRGLMQQLLADWDAATVNPDDVHAQVDKRIDALRAFAHDAADASIQVHDILTPDQRAQVSQGLRSHFERARGVQSGQPAQQQ
jgi:Spy/CpxP family protein refolding chaperone